MEQDLFIVLDLNLEDMYLPLELDVESYRIEYAGSASSPVATSIFEAHYALATFSDSDAVGLTR